MYEREAPDENRRAAATRRAGAATLAIVAVVALAVGAAVAPPAVAEHGEDDDAYVATQGDDCVELAVLGDGTEPVSSFYDYRWQDGHRYASYGTTHLQRSSASQLFAYHGSEGVSLVFLHDELGDEAGGGAVSMELDGLPAGDWPVVDDDYPESDDEFQDRGDAATIHWMYAPNRTDGGAFRGLENLEDGDAIGIDPAFGEDSYAAQERNWPWADGDLEWYVRHGAGTGDLTSVSETERLEVRRGTCQSEALEAYLTASPSTATAGEAVALEASASVDAADVDEYRWDVDGDGEVDRTTDAPETTLVYEDAGTVEPSVTVVASDGETASATASVTVEADVTAHASADATEVETGDAVTLDGSDSTVAGADASYQWNLGDGSSATGQTVEHAYDEPGTYVAELVVTTDDGTSDAASVSIQVDDGDGESGGDDGSDGDGPDDGDESDGDDPDDSDDDDRDEGDGDGEDDDDESNGDDSNEGDGDGDGRDDDGEDDGDDDEDDGGEFDGGESDGDDANDDDGAGGPWSGDEDDDEDDPDESDGDDWWSDDGDDAPGVTWSDDGTLAVQFEDVDGERVRATVDDDGERPGDLAAIEIEPAGDAEQWSATWSTTDEPSGPSGAVALDELSPAEGAEVDAVAYEFAVDANAVPGRAEDLQVLAHDGSSWRALETDVDEDGSTLTIEAESDALERVVLASVAGDAGGGDVQLVDVAVEERGADTVVVNATYRNDGWTPAETDAALTVDGEVAEERTVDVPAGSSRTVSFEREFDDAGTHAVAVGDEERTVEVSEERTAGAASGLPVGTTWVLAGLVGLVVVVLLAGRLMVE